MLSLDREVPWDWNSDLTIKAMVLLERRSVGGRCLWLKCMAW
jgi:hypothetical protein